MDSTQPGAPAGHGPAQNAGHAPAQNAGHGPAQNAGRTSPANLPLDAHRRSSLFPPEVIAQIQRTAAEGHYEIRG